MSKNNTPIRLVKSPNQWSELDDTVRECVSTLCSDDQNRVRSLVTLLDLITNVHYAADDRETVAWQALRQTFLYSIECEGAQQRYIDSLVMPARERKTA